MTFTSLGIIALVLLSLAVIKILVFLINPQAWMNFSKSLFKNKFFFQLVCLILALIVFYYLVHSLTIIQIFAAIAFVALFIGIGLADSYGKIISIYEKQIKEKSLWKKNWLYILLWLALMVWVFIELFF